MYKTAGFIFLYSILVFSGCATSQRDAELKASIQKLEKKLKNNRRRMEELREKYLVLESLVAQENNNKVKGPENEVDASVQTPVPISPEEAMAQVQSAIEEKIEKESDPYPSFQNEHYMYAKVIESYRQRDGEILKRVVDLFLRSFPVSVHADNALFLLGDQYMKARQWQLAVGVFNRIEKEYPLANKRSSGLLSRALAYKQLRKISEAQKELEFVIRTFPGSHEAFLAKTELQLLQAGG